MMEMDTKAENGSADRLCTGGDVHLTQAEAEIVNMRVLDERRRKCKPFLIPAEQPLELLFFRFLFRHMRDSEQEPNECANGCGTVLADRSSHCHVCGTKRPIEIADDEGGSIPIQEFQRTLERLFFVLGDPTGFDASRYDLDGNGSVGWGEFCVVFQERRIVINLSLAERIFIVLDDPESCDLARYISSFVLMVIFVSSSSFILSTHPQFTHYPVDGMEPQKFGIFKQVELACLYIFIIEYTLRVCTCWMVRHELSDRQRLLQVTISSEVLSTPNKLERLVRFVFQPGNFIDLFAILPGVAGMIYNINGGGFVVLRLIRLTRILRLIRVLRIPTTAIVRALQQSTNALYVLLFNLGLGVVICGSLMYQSEQGVWDNSTYTYLRTKGQEWDFVEKKFVHKYEESPWPSIPHALWWVMTTATTVGYGDQYPTTTWGYVIATVAMVFFLVIMTLPIGVIGREFSTSYSELLNEESEAVKDENTEVRLINESVQILDAFRMSNLMLIDVWNERLPHLAKRGWETTHNGGRPNSAGRANTGKALFYGLPYNAEFLGRARFELPLEFDSPTSGEITLPLKEDMEIVKRKVTGNITIKYEWEPTDVPDLDDDDGVTGRPRIDTDDTQCLTAHAALYGRLKITVLAADNLCNINRSSMTSASNPYCMVYCYTKPPQNAGEVVEPSCWRSSTVMSDLNPRWNCSHRFSFCWPRADSLADTMHCTGAIAHKAELDKNEVEVGVEPMRAEVIAPPGHIEETHAEAPRTVSGNPGGAAHWH